jgi:hypothetical protein
MHQAVSYTASVKNAKFPGEKISTLQSFCHLAAGLSLSLLDRIVPFRGLPLLIEKLPNA